MGRGRIKRDHICYSVRSLIRWMARTEVPWYEPVPRDGGMQVWRWSCWKG